jgi:integrase
MRDLEQGFGSVELPFALARKYPHADKELAWQYIFPSDRLSTDPRSGITRRHHLDPSGLQRAVKAAATLAKINKPVSPHTFRHCFATTCSKQAMISAPCRNYSATRMSKRR